MPYWPDYNTPYYNGSAALTLAAHAFPVALDGIAFELDKDRDDIPGGLRFQSIPMRREQFDQSDNPGEQTLSSEGFWRRVGESFHFGAGQEYYDRKDSNRERYKQSFCIDPWTKWQFGLHKITKQKVVSINTNLYTVGLSTHYYFTDGQTLKFSTDLTVEEPTLTTVTGTPAVAASSIASDGFYVWITVAASGIYRTSRGAAAAAQQMTTAIGATAVIRHCRGRVIVLDGNDIYDATTVGYAGAPGALPAALFSHPSTSDFQFIDAAEGRNAIYFLGVSGNRTFVYRSTLKQDGSGLDAPIVTAEFDGETGVSLYGYLGSFIFIGMTNGWRACQVQESGDLVVGARVTTPLAVRCFEGQNQFVWHGYSAFDLFNSGLGRISLSHFSDIDNFVPAQAPDLMARKTGLPLNTTFGQLAFTPDHADLDQTGDINIVARVKLPDYTPSASHVFYTKDDVIFGSNVKSYKFWLNTSGNLVFSYSTGGVTWVDRVATAATGVTDGTETFFGVDFDAVNGANHVVRFWKSTNGRDWTQIGANVTTAGNITMFSGAGQGAIALPSGTVYSARVGTGITVGAGTILTNPDFTNQHSDYSSVTDSTGKVYALTGTPPASFISEVFNNDVQSVVTFQDLRVFSVSGQGIYAEHTEELEHEGYLETGQIQFNIPDNKASLFFDVKQRLGTEELGTHEVQVSIDLGPFQSLGEHVMHEQPFTMAGALAEHFSFRLILKRDSAQVDMGQILTAWLHRVEPAPIVGDFIWAALLFNTEVIDYEGGYSSYDPFALYTLFKDMRDNRRVVSFQAGATTTSVILDDFEIEVHELEEDYAGLQARGFNGTCMAKMKVVA